MKEAATMNTTTYQVTIKVDGTYPDDPYFEGRTGNAYPDFTLEVQADTDHTGYAMHPATTPAMALYPYPLSGEVVEYEITEVK